MGIDFAELHRRVVFDQSDGQIIWQPRIGCWYTDKQFDQEPLPPPFTGMSLVEIYRELGCSARIYDYNACYRAVEHPAVRLSSRWLNETDQETTVSTPVGKQRLVTRKVTSNWYHITLKWWVTTEEELKVATWRAENTTWEWDQAAFESVQATWGNLGAPTMFMPRVNIQDLYINTMGVENAIYALHDWRDTVEAYFRALEESHDRLIDLFAPKLVLGISDEISSHGEIERIRVVGRIVEKYNASRRSPASRDR